MNDGASAGRTATRLALDAAKADAADLVVVFAGAKHDADDYASVLAAARETAGAAADMVGCSTTGIITAAAEIENASAVAVLVLAGGSEGDALPAPLFSSPLRPDPPGGGAWPGPAG